MTGIKVIERFLGLFHKALKTLTIMAMVAGFSVAVPVPALASDQTGNVTRIAMAGGRLLFWVSGTRTARPTCDCCDRWEISVATPEGQAFLALLMTARAQGMPVVIAGSGSCFGGSSDTEGVNYIQFGM